MVRPAFTASTRWSVITVEPISMSVPLLSAMAAAPTSSVEMGGPVTDSRHMDDA